jgi:hypothetical protein
MNRKTVLLFIAGLGLGVIIGPYFWRIFCLSILPLQELGRAAWLDTPTKPINKLIGVWFSENSTDGTEFTHSGQHRTLHLITETGTLGYDYTPRHDGNYEIHGDWIFFGSRSYSFAMSYRCKFKVNDSSLVLYYTDGRKLEYRRYNIGDTIGPFVHSSCSIYYGAFPASYTIPLGSSADPPACAEFGKKDSVLQIKSINLSTAPQTIPSAYNTDFISFQLIRFHGLGSYPIVRLLNTSSPTGMATMSYTGCSSRYILNQYLDDLLRQGNMNVNEYRRFYNHDYPDQMLPVEGFINITQFDTRQNLRTRYLYV